jgi:hypothetical protein
MIGYTDNYIGINGNSGLVYIAAPDREEKEKTT